MSLETLEQLDFRTNLEKLLDDFRNEIVDTFNRESEEYQFYAEEAVLSIETDVAIHKFIRENCK